MFILFCNSNISIKLNKIFTVRFTAFPEIELNPGLKDIEDIRAIRDIGDCQWGKLTHCVAITHPHPHPHTLIIDEM
jgi:hypothetical protein